MPRRKKSSRPLPAISGDAAPRAALRNTSYGRDGGRLDRACRRRGNVCLLLFLEPVRSMWDGARYRVPGAAAWQVPGRGRFLLGRDAPAEMPRPCRRSCGTRGPGSVVGTSPAMPAISSPWPGSRSAWKHHTRRRPPSPTPCRWRRDAASRI